MTTDFPLHRNPNPIGDAERAAILSDPGFGRYFTDHMTTAVWSKADGWHDQQVGPLRPFSLHPAAAVFHYAQEIFEGLKAYRHQDGSVWLFRPGDNARRFQRSARRLALPELDEDAFIASVEQLVRADEPWVPAHGDEKSLYIRPYMFASESFLGVRPGNVVQYAVIAGPAGPYFSSGVTGVTLWVSQNYTRSAVGGTGDAKCGGNYAGSLAAQIEAQQRGADQVLYLDSQDRDKLEESGTMNVCLVTSDGTLVTPGLGTILEGVTRDSVLALAEEHGLTPVERSITIHELRDGCGDGTITEVFAAGTAAVLTPIVKLIGDDLDITVGDGKPGKVTLDIREHILDIQYGRAEDTRGWLRRVV